MYLRSPLASLPGLRLVTQIWRLSLSSAQEAAAHKTAFPGGTWELATWGVKPLDRFANRIIYSLAGWQEMQHSQPALSLTANK